MTEASLLPTFQKERLAHIEFRAYFLGGVRRRDLSARFGIKAAAATRDFSLYHELAPRNLLYDPRKKLYMPTERFKPLFSYSTSRVLSTLAEGFGDGLKDEGNITIEVQTPAQLNKPHLSTVALVSRAIANQQVLEIGYRSLTRGETRRETLPFALVDNGIRWHMRAYDRRRARFTNFVLTRIASPRLLPESPVEEHEKSENDKQWRTTVTLELVPHPALEHKETIEKDYAMRNGVLKIPMRAALAGYTLRRWNVDCSPDHHLRGGEYHLALRNVDVLDGSVDTMLLAPGYR